MPTPLIFPRVVRAGTADQWAGKVHGAGADRIGILTDGRRGMKVLDGVTVWEELPFLDTTGRLFMVEGVTNATTMGNRLAAAIDKVDSEGGGVIGIYGNCSINETIVIPHGVGLIGRGKYAGDIISCGTNGQISLGERTVEARLPTVGDLIIHGNNQASNPLYIGLVVESAFGPVRVLNGTDQNIFIQSAQNCSFYGWESIGGTGTDYATRIDNGVLNLDFFHLNSRNATTAALAILQADTTDVTGTLAPGNLRFFGGLNESSPIAIAIGAVQQQCMFFGVQTSASGQAVVVDAALSSSSSSLMSASFIGCQLKPGSGEAAVRVNGTSARQPTVTVDGCRFRLAGTMFETNQYGYIIDRGGHSIDDSAPTYYDDTDGVATQATNTLMAAPFGVNTVAQPLLATGASATVDDVIAVLQTLGLVRQA